MSGWCPSCGGIIGRECFNPAECAWITAAMAHRAEEDRYAEMERDYYASLEREAVRPEAETT